MEALLTMALMVFLLVSGFAIMLGRKDVPGRIARWFWRQTKRLGRRLWRAGWRYLCRFLVGLGRRCGPVGERFPLLVGSLVAVTAGLIIALLAEVLGF